jgi:hypothetical protein
LAAKAKTTRHKAEQIIRVKKAVKAEVLPADTLPKIASGETTIKKALKEVEKAAPAHATMEPSARYCSPKDNTPRRGKKTPAPATAVEPPAPPMTPKLPVTAPELRRTLSDFLVPRLQLAIEKEYIKRLKYLDDLDPKTERIAKQKAEKRAEEFGVRWASTALEDLQNKVKKYDYSPLAEEDFYRPRHEQDED